MTRIVVPVMLLVVALSLFGASRMAHAAALNETDTAEEFDQCVLLAPTTGSVSAGGSIQLFGRVFEAGVTDIPGPGVTPLQVEFGIGDIGTDPRFDPAWSFQTASFDSDVGNGDVWQALVTAPSAAVGTQFAYVFRVSQDGGSDHTYCDTGGSGSNPGEDFSIAELGILTISGGSEGSVNTSVDVISDPGACILLSTNNVSYGELTFSTQNAAQTGNAGVTLTSCSLTTSLDLLAKGTDATGPTAAWSLTTPPGSLNMCDTGNDGVDQFGQSVGGVHLSLGNQTYSIGLAQGQSLPTPLTLRMPCIGSGGNGETVSSSITFTAIPGPPPFDPCADPPFVPNADSECVAGVITYICHAGFSDLDGDPGNGCEASDFDLDGHFTPQDCDDFDENVHPGAPEILNGIDDDCDGLADEDLLVDADADGFTLPSDCNDADASVFPGATEVLNGIDDDCDGAVDEGFLIDADLDGFSPPQDCNDANPNVHPGATEVLGDGIDSDCDGTDG